MDELLGHDDWCVQKQKWRVKCQMLIPQIAINIHYVHIWSYFQKDRKVTDYCTFTTCYHYFNWILHFSDFGNATNFLTVNSHFSYPYKEMVSLFDSARIFAERHGNEQKSREVVQKTLAIEDNCATAPPDTVFNMLGLPGRLRRLRWIEMGVR